MDSITALLAANPTLTTALVVIAVALVINELVVAARSGYKLDPASAVRLINDRSPVIVDIRNLADFKKGHVPGARNLPLSRLGEADSVLGDKDQPLLLVCALGTTASTARAKLQKQGYGEIYAIRGGLSAWQGADLPLEKPQKAKKADKTAGSEKKGGGKRGGKAKKAAHAGRAGPAKPATRGARGNPKPSAAVEADAAPDAASESADAPDAPNKPARQRKAARTTTGKTPDLSAR